MADPQLRFVLADGEVHTIRVRHLLNAGYTGRDAEQVRRHVDELAPLGVPAPRSTPTLYPLPSYLSTQGDRVDVQHERTSGEAEWALAIGEHPDHVVVTAACDHTDRALEAHGIGWSKTTAPDFLGDVAWRLDDVADVLDEFTLRGWVTHDGRESLIQEERLSALLAPGYWLERLAEHGLLRPGTVLLGGTVPMIPGVSPYADAWRVELTHPDGRASTVAYRCDRLPAAWE